MGPEITKSQVDGTADKEGNHNYFDFDQISNSQCLPAPHMICKDKILNVFGIIIV